MHLGKVLGNVVATIKYDDLEGEKFLLVQPVDHNLKPSGEPLTAIDAVRAGEGELIYYVLGREASLAMERQFVPVDAAIIGIVDGVHIEGEIPKIKSKKKKGRARQKHTRKGA